ncbi:Golgi apparatus membrane protein [Lachnellula subtilissima]|uniref:Golgi apparatus membrane protein n=1 Tax=Lachnellula subtilissima TaxID=602034 RepID=A0A8H8U809_9HELO|nr:Golgi apparatus membrane protein [Lachnellula subtilissima]
MTIAEEFATRNFSRLLGNTTLLELASYGKLGIHGNNADIEGNGRTGVICIFLCFALGISHLFHVSIMILFGAICLASSFLIIFIEIPLLLRICPTSAKFDTFMRRFTTNYMRAGIYLVMAIIQWLSIIKEASSLIAAAIMLTVAAAFYALAGVKGQGFVGSKTLGGQGVAQMII